YGLYYAPDPSSQSVSTIGGNVAENAGGAHCLKYGVTTNHVLGMEAVGADGSVVRMGSFPERGDQPGYDLPGLVCGSEGNLVFVTAVCVRLQARAESVRTVLALFDSALAAGDACSGIISAGIVPAALEFIDRHVIAALRGAGFLDYPPEAAAVVLVEVEGLTEQTGDEGERVHRVLRERGATEVRVAETAVDRARLWAGRKGAAGSLGHLAPNYYIQDGVVPRSRMVEVLAKIEEIAERTRLRVVNVFHAGDGNLHPTIVFDAREPGLLDRVIEAGAEILRACVDAGGTLSGEHGIGLEKMAYLDWVMSAEDQAAQVAIKRVFDPTGRLNPGKPFSGPFA
ncbi:MAG TPA: FAD-linked oxidase C-terminal domain-containing protein, partial [Chloroflexota bacterium]|nr:FAD-linked oxidase C-terminal domain-containing protein [Chloroflexota bacterium]